MFDGSHSGFGAQTMQETRLILTDGLAKQTQINQK